MSTTMTADWRWIAERPELIRETVRPKTVRPSKYRLYAQVASAVTLVVNQHWNDIDERFRHLLRVTVACTLAEPSSVVSKWEMFVSAGQVLCAFLLDREAVSEYVSAITAARKAVMNAIERESEEYHAVLNSAIAEVTSGTTGRSTMTAREASELTRSL
jgi:hypothetical protein